jgi:pimeloyl-ACP methyl ester carboxylesterase
VRVSEIPRTRYAKSGDLNIAYQVLGDGPLDLVFVPGFVSNVEMMWEEPALARFLRRLASFTRLIVFDKRGTGLSDRVPVAELPMLDERMDDVRAVMDAAGSTRAAIFGVSEGGCMSILFAATYPERTSALVLYGCFAKRLRSPDYPWAPTLEERLADVKDTEEHWGDAVDLDHYAPSLHGDRAFGEWFSAYFRRSASPAAAAALLRMNGMIDVRAVLPSVRVPTLVMQGVGDVQVNVEEGRYLASRIEGARFVALPNSDHLFWVSHQDEVIGEIQEFITGARAPVEADRFLATVLFTDIVNGTAKAAELGDRAWRDLVERHHALVRVELARHRGREIDTAGDGFFASFDGPGRAVRCGLAIRDAVDALGIQIRAGIHTGECEEIAGKVGGVAVIIGARVREQAHPGEVLASSTVRDLVAGSGLRFDDRGEHHLKGVPGAWHLFAAS